MWSGRGRLEQQLDSRADPHPKKVIPYKEYAAHKEAKGKVSTTSKPTLEEEKL